MTAGSGASRRLLASAGNTGLKRKRGEALLAVRFSRPLPCPGNVTQSSASEPRRWMGLCLAYASGWDGWGLAGLCVRGLEIDGAGWGGGFGFWFGRILGGDFFFDVLQLTPWFVFFEAL